MSDDLLDALAALGKTEEQIAASLRARGVTGERRNSRCCPLARYLTAELGRQVVVDGDSICIDGPSSWQESVWPDRCVADFIEGFDHGDYPDLVERTQP